MNLRQFLGVEPKSPSYKTVDSEWTFPAVTKLIQIASDEQLASGLGFNKDEAVPFINVLDSALDSPHFNEELRSKSILVLRKLCGKWEIMPKSYTPSKGLKVTSKTPVGLGGLSNVWQGKFNDEVVAIKTIRVSATDDFRKLKKLFYREALIWKHLSHKNILPFLGAFKTPSVCLGPSPALSSFCLVSCWMKSGNIREYVKAYPEANRMELLVDVVTGLMYLHSLDLVHGDLKGANIFINDASHACLADFGLMTVGYEFNTEFVSTISTVHGGTFRWMAPELLYPEQFDLEHSTMTKQSDIYAMGMVIYEVLTGIVPFDGHRNETVVVMVVNGSRPTQPSNNDWISSFVWHTIECCWRQERNERLPLSSLLVVLEDAAESCSLLSLRTRYSPGSSIRSLKGKSIDSSDPLAILQNASVDALRLQANSAFSQFHRTGNMDDLGEAIKYSRALLKLQPSGHPDYPESLQTLARCVYVQFKRTSERDCLHEAIYLFSEALQLIPPGDSRSHSLYHLARAIYDVFVKTKRMQHLDLAIQFYTESLNRCSNKNRKIFRRCYSLSQALYSRYTKSGSLKDLNEAIKFHCKSLPLHPSDHHPEKSVSINRLAFIFFLRFVRTDQILDLDFAIQFWYMALNFGPRGHPCRLETLLHLAWARYRRFQLTNQLDDLEESIQFHLEALQLENADSDHNSTRSGLIYRLAQAVQYRYERTGTFKDLEYVIKLYREIEGCPDLPTPTRVERLYQLSYALYTRFEATGEGADLEEAIELDREARRIRPSDYPDRHDLWNSLAYAKYFRFKMTGALVDYWEFVRACRAEAPSIAFCG